MKLVISVILSILVVVQCRVLNRATDGNDPLSEESARTEDCEDDGCSPKTEPAVEESTDDAIDDMFESYFWRIYRSWVGTEFRFWGPGKTSPLVITNDNVYESITENSGFDATLKVFFIVHGFHGGDAPWAVTMKDTLMQKGPCNVFIVDWSGGDGILYRAAATNSWIVGAEIGRFIERIQIKTGLKLQKVHIIGHNLGAHAAGVAGKYIRNILNNLVGRITGLDPAGPIFSDVKPDDRLNKEDAAFVDIIHTNGAENFLEGIGIAKPIGHFDFYPNGGKDQPGCLTAGQAGEEIASETLEIIRPMYKGISLIEADKKNISDVLEAFACSQGRSIQFFIESLNSKGCRFDSDQCTTWEDYQAGKCNGNLRVPMGYKAKKFKNSIDANTHKTFYLHTNAQSPFCKE